MRQEEGFKGRPFEPWVLNNRGDLNFCVPSSLLRGAPNEVLFIVVTRLTTKAMLSIVVIRSQTNAVSFITVLRATTKSMLLTVVIRSATKTMSLIVIHSEQTRYCS